MINVKELRFATGGLPDDATLELHLLSAPNGLEVNFLDIAEDDGRALFTAEAFFTKDAGGDDEEEAYEPVYVRDVRAATAGLPDSAPVNLRFVGAPEGLEVEFMKVVEDAARVLIRGEAFFPDEG